MKLHSSSILGIVSSRGMAAASISIPGLSKCLLCDQKQPQTLRPASAFGNPQTGFTRVHLFRANNSCSLSFSAAFTSSTWRCAKQGRMGHSATATARQVVKARSEYDDGMGFSHGESYSSGVKFARPEEVAWQKELANTVHLIGVLGKPVQIKYLDSGKAFAWTSLGVKKSAKSEETMWINLSFWNELAETAAQHLNKCDTVYISGRLVTETAAGVDDRPRIFYKVVVSNLNFVERKSPAYSQQRDGDMNASFQSQKAQVKTSSSGKRTGDDAANIESLWQAFFANPLEWWDNRTNKRNPKGPDFKHKDTGEALWIEGRSNPAWVKSQLAVLDSRMVSQQWGRGGSAVRSQDSSSTFRDSDFLAF
eukprot:Gb_13980 [translate_table: standard]